jgi:catalase
VELAEQAVEAVGDIYGRHAGYRAVHAKGILCAGTFTATPEAARLTRAAHMQGEPIEVTVRFSNAGGDPNEHDGIPDGRGMATKLYLQDGSRTDMLAVTADRFFARTPEEFIEFNRAVSRPPGGRPRPNPVKMLMYLARHPRAAPAVAALREAASIPSYARRRYNSLHAFRWIDAAGGARHVKFSWLPEEGEAKISTDEALAKPPDYLQRDLVERFAGGTPIRFTLELQLAAEGDPLDDPRRAWPAERERVIAGTLELAGLDTRRERDGDVLVFDPTRVTDGIELTDDPILRFRPKAYSVSVERRSGARPETHSPSKEGQR